MGINLKHSRWAWLTVVALLLGLLLAMLEPAFSGSADASDFAWSAIPLRLCIYFPLCLAALALLRQLTKWWRQSLVVLFGLVILFYAEEDWRGWHAWQQYRLAWEAKGERFDLASFIPPPVPDDQNFAFAPIVASTYLRYLDKTGRKLRPENTNVVNQLEMRTESRREDTVENTNGLGDWQRAEHINLAGWQQYYRKLDDSDFPSHTNEFPMSPHPKSPAADVLLALSKYDPALDELRTAAKKSRASKFPLNYDSPAITTLLLPHLYTFEDCCQVLELRAIAELTNDQSGKAVEDIKLLVRLSDLVRHEPGFISQFDRLRFLQNTLQPIWEGTAAHQWSDVQLAELNRSLGDINLLAEYPFALRSERAMNLATIEFMRHHRLQAWRCLPMISFLSRPENYEPPEDYEHYPAHPILLELIAFLLPSGWFYTSEMTIGRIYEPSLPAADPKGSGLDLDSVAAHGADSRKKYEQQHRNRYNEIAFIACPYFERLAEYFIQTQSCLDLARVGCALERYHLAHDVYPDSLSLLSPQFLTAIPADVINGQPLHYRRTPKGSFVLYSVGWNEKDDGGVHGVSASGYDDYRKGDWVWTGGVGN